MSLTFKNKGCLRIWYLVEKMYLKYNVVTMYLNPDPATGLYTPTGIVASI
jgi:hypothetical protein